MAEEQAETTAKNTVTIEDAGPCKKKVMVQIPDEAIKNVTDEQYKTLRKEADVPGFRRGRVPRRLLEKRFGKEVSEQIKLKLLADASESAIKDNELEVLRDPDIDYEKIELPAEGALNFDFEIEVRPEFELPMLEEIAVNKTKLEVTDEQVDNEIEQMQKWSGTWTPKEGGEVAAEDQIIADVIMKVEDVEEEEKLDNTEIFARKNGFVGAIPVNDLDEILIGAKAGDSKETSVEVPKTYFREEYRGKKVDIQISVKDIKRLEPAALNEDFFKRLGVDDKADLHEKIRESLQGRLESQGRTEMSEQIYKYMLDNTKFELPLDIVADQAKSLLQRQYANLLRQGLGQEELEERMEQLRAANEQQAQEQLKIFFIMSKVAEKLEIEVSEEEINGHIAQLAIQRGQRPEQMREQMARDGSLTQFGMQIRDDKCIAKLLESAKITEVAAKKKAKKAATGQKKSPKKTDKTKKKTDE